MVSARIGPMIKIAPSILSADFAALGHDSARVEAGGADQLHVDVMDGRFVPNITIGPVVVAAIRKRTRLPLDVHLMIVEPERYISGFVAAGADMVTVHAEACPHLSRTLALIRRSEEHTSELQSPCNLVCRLLLEKKNNTKHMIVANYTST